MSETGSGQGARTGIDGQGTRLESWKEIAAYLGRDVTTVQRWERREGLPVHRLLHSKIGSIFAYTNELEAWRDTRSHQQAPPGPTTGTSPLPAGATSLPDTDPGLTFSAADNEPSGATLLPADPTPAPVATSGGPATSTGVDAWIPVTLLVLLLITVSMLAWEMWSHRDTPARSALTPVRAIAVLPLRNLSGDPSQEYFADGMTEAVIARLASLGDLQVISRTSVMQFKHVDKPVPEIASALNADVILEGSVLRSGQRVRVIAQLIDGRTDAHLWAAEYDREVRDVLALQGELAQAIAAHVSATVRDPAARANANAPVSSEAYEHYLKGRYLLNESSADSVQRSLKEFQAAIAADPAFAPAYAGMAAAHTDLGMVLIGAAPGSESVDRAVAAANEAVKRDPFLAEGYSVLGRALTGQWRWKEAEAAFRRALDLNPSDARTHYWYAEWLIAHHRPTEAAESARRGRDLDPLSMRVGAEYGLMLGFARRHEEAVRQLRSVLAVQPDHVQAMWWLGTNLNDLGRSAEALPLLERAAAQSGRSAGVLAPLARAYVKVGRRANAERILEELRSRRAMSFAPPTTIAAVYLVLGDRASALQWYTTAVDEKANGLPLTWASAVTDPLHGDPRFVALFARMGLPVAPDAPPR